MAEELGLVATIGAIVLGIGATVVVEWRYVRRNGWRRHLIASLIMLALPWALFIYGLVFAASMKPYLLGFFAFVLVLIAYVPASVVAVIVGFTTRQRPLLWFSASAVIACLAVAGVVFISIPGN